MFKMVRQNRNRRRRVRLARNKTNNGQTVAKTVLPVRTLNMVENTLKRKFQPRSQLNGVLANYVRCRLDPFSTGSGAGGTPDSAMVPRIVVDHRDFGTITCGTSGGFQVRLIPNIPCPLVMKPTGAFAGFSVNGVSIAACTAPLTVAASNYGWVPVVTLAEWDAWLTLAAATPAGEIPGPYSAVKARIVSLAVRIYYTGAASTAAGTVTVTADRSVATFPALETTVVIPVNQTTAAGTTNVTTYGSRCDFGTTTPVLDKTTITERSEVPLRVVPRRLDELKPWLDMPQAPYLMHDQGVGSSFINTDVNARVTCTALYDDNFEQAVITFAGLPTNAPFRFETAVCVEYQPMPTSAVAKLAKKPETTFDSSVISKTEAGLSKQPLAAPPGAAPAPATISKEIFDAAHADANALAKQLNSIGLAPTKIGDPSGGWTEFIPGAYGVGGTRRRR
jgi:hypothetical protein